MSKRIALLATVAALAVTPALAQQSTQPSPTTPPAAQPSTPPTSSPTSPSTSGSSPSSSSTMQKDSQAQDSTKDSMSKDTMSKGTASTTTKATPKFVNTQTSDQWLASDLMELNVLGSKDEKIGSVSDLLVDQQGNIIAAVVGVGGFLGIGQKNVAISFDSMNVTKDKDGDPQARLTLTKDELENAPEFKTAAQAASDAKRPAATPGSSPARPATPAK